MDQEASYLLDDYDSEEETTKPRISTDPKEVGGISTKSFDLLTRCALLRLCDSASMFNR